MATITGTSGNDVLNGTELDDLISGLAGNDTLNGFGGNDTLDGGPGADRMVGGAGDDVYHVDDAQDQVTEAAGEGIDTIIMSIGFSAPANVENLTYVGGVDGVGFGGNDLDNVITGNALSQTMLGLGGTDTISYAYEVNAVVVNLETGMATGSGNDVISSFENAIGGSAADTLVGTTGANVLDGRGGADTLRGDFGNDTYYVDDANDRVIEVPNQAALLALGGALPGGDAALLPNALEGFIDTVIAAISYSLANVADVENLLLAAASAAAAGTGNELDNELTGNELNNTLSGMGGHDTLDGGAGDDTLIGGSGDDLYILDSAGDVITELPGGGTDRVDAKVSFSLAAFAEVEHLMLIGDAAIDGTGNAHANLLVGNASHNTLNGLGGNDTLDGGGGIDTAVYAGNRAAYTIGGSGTAISGAEGDDTLLSTERVRFADTNLAFDLGAGASAGNTVRIIGAAFGAPTIAQQPDYVGIGLNLFDAGTSMQQVCELVVQILGLSNTAFVTTVYTNVVGVAPSTQELNAFVGQLEGGTSQATLLELAATIELNELNINLVGLQASGVEFV
jgi:Ca2+-binding RTX toxin-like protein